MSSCGLRKTTCWRGITFPSVSQQLGQAYVPGRVCGRYDTSRICASRSPACCTFSCRSWPSRSEISAAVSLNRLCNAAARFRATFLSCVSTLSIASRVSIVVWSYCAGETIGRHTAGEVERAAPRRLQSRLDRRARRQCVVCLRAADVKQCYLDRQRQITPLRPQCEHL